MDLPRRDAQGRFLECPKWLLPGVYGWNGPLQRRCQHPGCRCVALRKSELCKAHDPAWGRKRRIQLRTGKGRKPSPRESAQLFRADTKALWTRSPWQPRATIWLAPKLERRFAHDLTLAGLSLADLAPVIANTLRWVWRRSRLNHDDHEGWQRALVHARKRQAKIGPPPEGYVHQPPGDTAPTDERIKAIYHQATAYEAARTEPVTDRTTKARLRRQRLNAPDEPAFDWQAFLNEHWHDTFGPLWRSYRLPDDPHGVTGKLLAIGWHDVLDERQRLGDGAVGYATRRWHSLLNQLKHGASVKPESPSPPTHARGNRYLPKIARGGRRSDLELARADDAMIRELMAKIEAQEAGSQSRG
jgi:hypothetical protein